MLVARDSVAPVFMFPGVYRRVLNTGERTMVVEVSLESGSIVPEHTHPHEQMTLIMQGKVKFTISGEPRILSAGDVLHFPPYNRHGATMLDEEVVLIDIFTPIREEFLVR